jgi:uncharacterized protein (TIGR02231 family)
MKNILFIILLFALTSNAENQKTVSPKPSKATVYLNGAELVYNIPLNLASGNHEIILEGVSPYLDENSISAYIKGAFVLDTRKSIRYPEQPKVVNPDEKYSKFIVNVDDSLNELGFVIKDCTNKKNGFEREKNLLLNNRLIRGEFRKDSLQLLKESMDLLRSRLTNIDEEILKLERALYKHYKVQEAMNNRKAHYQRILQNGGAVLDNVPFKSVEQVIVNIEVEEAVNTTLNVRYYVPNAGWLPRYDIVASSESNEIKLISRAQVSQNTGIDWKDISLVLSTSNPRESNTKPQLNIWNLNYGYPNSYLQKTNKALYNNAYNNNLQYNTVPAMKAEDLNERDNGAKTNSDDVRFDFGVNAAPILSVSENLLRTEYVIKSKYSITSDLKMHNVVVNTIDVPVDMTYMAVPKLDKNAFLMAKIANWEDLNLLPANARIYYDESFIGMSVIDPGTVKDTLYLDMGRDKGINIKRQNLKDKCKEQVLGDDKIHVKTVEITIRNTKGVTLDFEIEDQIPISSDPSIKITLLDKDGALYNEATGKLVWKTKIKAKGTEKIVFSFEVRHPKTKIIPNL